MDVIPIRGRGGKDRGRADDEDAVMEMDIDPSTGNWYLIVQVCLVYCSSEALLYESIGASNNQLLRPEYIRV